jgi:hypothetical protein
MNRFVARSLMAGLLAAAAALVTAATPVSAHETRGDGPVRFVVGWGDEPTYTGFKNSVQVTVTEASGSAVTDLGDTLKVEVIKGTDRTTLPLVANFRVGGFGTPGDYRAWLTPTRPGSYTFRLTGTVRGQNVNESFTSSRTTFNEVEDMTSIAFPAKDPSTGQLATRIDREVPRLETALREAEESADGARSLALAGVFVGAVGMLTAAGALVLARRRSHGRGAGREPEPLVSEMARPNV